MADKSSEFVFQADVSQFTQAINQMKSDMKLIDSQFDASSSSLDDWSKNSEGLEAKIMQLNSTLKSQETVLASMKSRQQEYVSTLEKNKSSLASLKNQYDAVIASEGEKSDSAKKLAKQMAQVEVAISKNEKAYKNEEIAINKQQATVNKTKKELKSYEKSLKTVGKETDDVSKKTKEANTSTGKFGNGLAKLGGGIMKGLAKSIAGVALSVAGLTTAFFASAESTREYRTEMAKLKTINDEVDASFEETKKAFQDLVAVTNDEGAATEAINNLLTAGFKGNELDEVNQYIQGAAIKWKDTLKAEGLSDSIQEWIGSGGASLTGNIAEMLERLGYNLETVKAETAGYTDEQRRAYLMNIMASEGLGEISEAYKEENKDMYEASMATQNLTDKMAGLGDIADPLITIFKNKLAKAIEYITPLLQRLGNAFELLLSKGNEMTGLQRLGEIFIDLKDKVNEIIIGIIERLTTAIPEILPKITEILLQIVNKMIEFTPQIIQVGTNLIKSLVEALPSVINTLIEQWPVLFNSLITAMNTAIPVLLEAAIQVFSSLVEALPIVIEKLVEILPQLIESLTGFLQQNLPVILNAAIELLYEIVKAIPIIIESLLEALPTIIDTVTKFLLDNLPFILTAAINLFTALVDAIPVIVQMLVQQLPQITKTIVYSIAKAIPTLLATSVDLYLSLVKAIPQILKSLATSLEDIVDTIIGAFDTDMLFDVGKEIIEGLWDGIKSLKKWLQKKLESAADWLPKWVKDKLGIASPSKVFKKLGVFSAEGLGLGFTNEMKKVKKSIENSVAMDDLALNGNVKVASSINRISGNNQSTNASSGNNVVLNYTVNSPTQLSRREIYIQAKKMATMLGGVH